MYSRHINLSGQPFDFDQWRQWLERKADALRAQGYEVKFGFTDETPKPSTSLMAKSKLSGGYFANWITGEADFEVMDLRSGSRIVEKMALIVSNASFEMTFDEFVSALKI